MVVVDLQNPLQPKVTATLGAPALEDPRGIAVQFRYAFVVDRYGMKVLDVTDLAMKVCGGAAFRRARSSGAQEIEPWARSPKRTSCEPCAARTPCSNRKMTF